MERLVAEGVAFFVLRVAGEATGCGGIKLFGREYGELKRMYVRPQFRGLGYGKLLLDQLANHVRSEGVSVLRLETGIHQQEAIRMYERAGFRRIPAFGSYLDDGICLCYEMRWNETSRNLKIIQPNPSESSPRRIFDRRDSATWISRRRRVGGW